MSVDVGGIVTRLLAGLLTGKGWWMVALVVGAVLFGLARSGRLDRPGRAVRDVLAQSWGRGGRGARVGAVVAWVALVGFVVVVDMAHVPSRAEAETVGITSTGPPPPVVAAVMAADSAPTATSKGAGGVGAGKGAPAPVTPALAASRRLLHIFGGECLSASNPDYPGNGAAVVEARWRHCLPIMYGAGQAAEPNGGSRALVYLSHQWQWAPYVPSSADTLAELNPDERATVRKYDAAMRAWAADVALVKAANDEAMSAWGGYWSLD